MSCTADLLISSGASDSLCHFLSRTADPLLISSGASCHFMSRTADLLLISSGASDSLCHFMSRTADPLLISSGASDSFGREPTTFVHINVC